ncbi:MULTISPECIES: hypothetical protein [unclassified Streptomyces]|uniref:hypothetical protein n=1 Tax=unclassified Streptomyces TaxID=2593676 RepID=UPI001F4F450A|nr:MULTISPECIES: hypothetical protein [unclassified Streptomyces]
MFALMVWGASSASAGGPTSVLVTSPQSAEATALYYADAEYGKLEQLLGPSGTGSRDQPPERELGGERQINATWMAHDISPWRVDRIFPGYSGSGSGPVWIHTAADVANGMNGYWHRAEHPDQLRALLGKLGVMGEDTGDGYGGIFPAPWESREPGVAGPSAPAADPAGDTAADSADTAADTPAARVGASGADEGAERWANWWWSLPGVAVGVALTLVVGALASRGPVNRWRRMRDGGSRQELRDV